MVHGARIFALVSVLIYFGLPNPSKSVTTDAPQHTNVGTPSFAPVTNCDRLAASRYDSERVAPDVPTHALGSEAVEVCRNAVKAFPNDRRLQATFARALSRTLDDASADDPRIDELYKNLFGSTQSGSGLGAFLAATIGSAGGDGDFAAPHLINALEHGSGYVVVAVRNAFAPFGRSDLLNAVQSDIFLEWLNARARGPSPTYKTLLAVCHWHGIVCSQDQSRALELFRGAANAGYVYAKVLLAEYNLRRVQITRDDAPAKKFEYPITLSEVNGRVFDEWEIAVVSLFTYQYLNGSSAHGNGKLRTEQLNGLRVLEALAKQRESYALYYLGKVYAESALFENETLAIKNLNQSKSLGNYFAADYLNSMPSAPNN